jgi:Na+-transporting NADH:ubiquinone oxidoreductase subunit NqrB
VHHLVGLSLLVFAVAVVSGLAVATARGLVAWRAIKSFRATAAEGMLATAVLLEQLEARSARSAERAARLARAQAQLQQSLAEAEVIAAGAREVQALVHGVRSLVPSK